MSGSIAAVINEFVFSHTGTDNREYIELKAAPNTDLSSLTLLVIEGESTGWGTIDRVFTPGTTDANGYWTTPFQTDQLENGTQTILLVSGFTGALLNDLDTNNDGTLDSTPWTAILDGVGVLDSGTGEFVYGGATVLAANYDGVSFTPGGASRIPDGTDTGAAGDWVRNDFDLAGIPGFTGTLAAGEALNTPGAANATTPPAAAQVTIGDVAVAEGDAGTTTLTFTVTRSNDAGAFTLDYATSDGTATAGSDYVAAGGTLSFAAGGPLTQTFAVTVNGDAMTETDETFTVTLSNLASTAGNATIADATATGTITNDEVVFTEIAAIQGAGHRSALVTANTGSGSGIAQAGNSGTARYNVEGVVTALGTNGFWIQDATPDADIATSDGIFVFTSSAPAATITVGETVRVLGARVDEFRAGTTSGTNNNLTITQLNSTVAGAAIQELGGDTAIDAILIGPGGRLPPTGAVSDAGFATFDPATDAIDFWESLEGMKVEIANPVAISITSEFRTRDPANSSNAAGPPSEEIWVFAEGGYDAGDLTPRGAPLLAQDDVNPERIQIDDLLNATDLPNVSVGTRFANITGIVGYDFQSYEVLAIAAPVVATPSPLAEETTTIARDARQLTIASYNVENLDPEVESTAVGSVDGSDLYTRLGNSDDDVGSGKYADHARQIAVNMGAPVIVALQEIQDSDGAEISGTVDAALTLQTLVDLIQANHGVTYAFAYANPPGSNQDGGQPNANIRPAYLYRPDLVTLVGATPGDPTSGVTRLTDPATGEADGFAGDDFAASRKPLEAVFEFNGERITLINNHFNSKGGDNAVFGNVQPPVLNSEAQRIEQAKIVNARVDAILAGDPAAKVVVLGDLNDFAWSAPNRTLDGTAGGGQRVLTDLAEALLPAGERSSYNFQGNAQTLDHTLVSDALLDEAAPAFDIVHVNSDLITGVSDHDPSVARFDFRAFSERLAGSAGDDRLAGFAGADSLGGGEGADTLRGGEGADSLVGGAGDDLLRGQDGNDVLEGGAGLDTLRGGDGVDTLRGGAEADLLEGGDSRDSLDGGEGSDSLAGEGGADTLTGGDGADELAGGAGRDVFLFTLHGAAAADEVMDFATGDRVAVLATAFDAALAPGRLAASRFQADADGQADSAAAGVFVFETDTAELWWDTDGDGAGRSLVASFDAGVLLRAADIFVV